MKKYILFTIIFFAKYSFAQTPQEVGAQIAQFINATTQIPFLAKVANVQGSVRVRVKLDENNLPESYSINQSLRKDCDDEALRVVKLINIRNLQNILVNKKAAIFEVPFFNSEKINYKNGEITEYFDKNKDRTDSVEISKFIRKYSIDSLSGLITGNVDYFEIKAKRLKQLGTFLLKTDNFERNLPDVLEHPSDSLQIIRYSVSNNLGFPDLFFNKYENGQVVNSGGGNLSYTYFNNGRIKSLTVLIETTTEKTSNETKWYANGQIAFEKSIIEKGVEITKKVISSWDTLGNQLVVNGNGNNIEFENYESKILTNTGLIKNGLKEGTWIGKYSDGNLFYTEEYEAGKCVKGVANYGNEVVNYTNPIQNAEMIGGQKGFQMHLLTNLRYPIDAQMSRKTGKVHLAFEVCTDGSLCNYEILKKAAPTLDEEALRVIKLSSGKWKPALFRGKPIKTKFNLPISFNLE